MALETLLGKKSKYSHEVLASYTLVYLGGKLTHTLVHWNCDTDK